MPLVAHAPGRVNLIGEHTDYTGGLAFPMAIDRGITLTAERRTGRIELTSAEVDGTVEADLPIDVDPSSFRPEWGSFVVSMARELGSTDGFAGRIESDIPAGAGLSSSAALECVIGVAMGMEDDPLRLALTAQRAEHAATGVPTGILDQLAIAAAADGHASLIDCHDLTVDHVPMPDDLDVVVRFVAHRTLVGSAYADRVEECRRAEELIGPLRLASLDDAEGIADDLLRRRARHVVSESQRVRDFASAMERGDHVEMGRLLDEGHASLRDDYDTSTDEMDRAVAELTARDDVFGARMTGGGFGGCLVLLAAPGAEVDGWLVRPTAGPRVIDRGD